MRLNQRQLYIIRHIATGNCNSGTQCRTIRLYKWKDAKRIVNQLTRAQMYRRNPATRERELVTNAPPPEYEIVPVTLEAGIPTE